MKVRHEAAGELLSLVNASFGGSGVKTADTTFIESLELRTSSYSSLSVVMAKRII